MLKRRPAVQALVPVKSLADSKLRLAGLLTPAERARFTLLMLDDVLANLAATAEISAVAVVSSDSDVLKLARQRNTRVLPQPFERESAADPLNNALMFAAKQLGEAGAVMIVPGDVPLVGADDYAAAIKGWLAGVVAVRAHDGGTNGLLSLGSDAMPYRFGSGSFEAHRAAAQALGLPFHAIEHPVWSRDIDSPDDVAWLAQYGDRCSSADFARQLLRAKDLLKRTA